MEKVDEICRNPLNYVPMRHSSAIGSAEDTVDGVTPSPWLEFMRAKDAENPDNAITVAKGVAISGTGSLAATGHGRAGLPPLPPGQSYYPCKKVKYLVGSKGTVDMAKMKDLTETSIKASIHITKTIAERALGGLSGVKADGELTFETGLFMTVAQSGVQVYKANQQHPYKTYKFHEMVSCPDLS